jgi:hypothetical protein
MPLHSDTPTYLRPGQTALEKELTETTTLAAAAMHAMGGGKAFVALQCSRWYTSSHTSVTPHFTATCQRMWCNNQMQLHW